MKYLGTLLLLLLAVQAQATTYWAATTGNGATCGTTGASDPGSGYTTLLKGVTCLSAGDTLNIKAGTYAGAAASNSAYLPINSLTGNSSAWITIQGIGSVIIAPSSMTAQYAAVQFLTNQYVLLKNLTIDARNASGPGIKIEDTSPFTRFDGVHVHDTSNGVPSAFPGPGLLVLANNVDFWNGSTHDNGTAANAYNFTGGQAPYGMYWEGSNGTVRNSKIYNNGGYGLHFFIQSGTITNSEISGNEIYNNGLHYYDGSGNLGQGSAAILASRGNGYKIFNNIIHGGTNQDGIGAFNTLDQSFIYNNTVYGMSQAGINMGAASNTAVKNNIFSNNATNMSSTAGFGGNTYNNNLCSALCGTGSSNVVDTAANTFVNAATGDFHLRATAFARNQGVSDLGPPYNTDYAGTPRVAPWDIGAYAYGVPITPPLNPQLVLALPLDEGSGVTAFDVSGQNNNATRVGGALWDNSGKYGKAIMFDGTGYLNIPYTPSLGLAPAMTLEAWIYPTAASSGFTTAIRQDRYYLYGSSEPGYCNSPVSAPLGGYHTSINNFICATSMPPLNEWSHVAVTYDGATTTFYLNGNIAASQTSTDPMVPSSNNVTIGASQYGEYFTGKIDEPRVYNYARTPAQIVSDMNTPLIGAPGKVVEIAAPASVEISSASSLEISAD